jgi:hypothetical protein
VERVAEQVKDTVKRAVKKVKNGVVKLSV